MYSNAYSTTHKTLALWWFWGFTWANHFLQKERDLEIYWAKLQNKVLLIISCDKSICQNESQAFKTQTKLLLLLQFNPATQVEQRGHRQTLSVSIFNQTISSSFQIGSLSPMKWNSICNVLDHIFPLDFFSSDHCRLYELVTAHKEGLLKAVVGNVKIAFN